MESKLKELENLRIRQTDDEREDQDEQKLCKSVIKVFARDNGRGCKASCALMTSPAKNCCGMKFDKFKNKN